MTEYNSEQSVTDLLEAVVANDVVQYAQSVAEAYDAVEQVYLAAIDPQPGSGTLAASANSR